MNHPSQPGYQLNIVPYQPLLYDVLWQQFMQGIIMSGCEFGFLLVRRWGVSSIFYSHSRPQISIVLMSKYTPPLSSRTESLTKSEKFGLFELFAFLQTCSILSGQFFTCQCKFCLERSVSFQSYFLQTLTNFSQHNLTIYGAFYIGQSQQIHTFLGKANQQQTVEPSTNKIRSFNIIFSKFNILIQIKCKLFIWENLFIQTEQNNSRSEGQTLPIINHMLIKLLKLFIIDGFNYLFKKVFRNKVIIPYQIIAILSIRHLALLSQEIQLSVQKQQFQKILITIIGLLIVRKFNLRHTISNGSTGIIAGCYQIQSALFRTYLTKLYLELVYFQPQFIHFGSLFLTSFTFVVLDIYENNQKLFKCCKYRFYIIYRRNIKQIHQIIAMIFFLAILTIPNLRYFHIFGGYLIQRAFEGFIFFSWIITTIIVGLQVFAFLSCSSKIQKLKKTKILQETFKNCKILLMAYLPILIVSLLFHKSWVTFWMDRRLYLQRFTCFAIIFAVNNVYNPLKISSNRIGIFSILCALLIFNTFYVTVQNMQNPNDQWRKMKEMKEHMEPSLNKLLNLAMWYGYILIIKSFYYGYTKQTKEQNKSKF